MFGLPCLIIFWLCKEHIIFFYFLVYISNILLFVDEMQQFNMAILDWDSECYCACLYSSVVRLNDNLVIEIGVGPLIVWYRVWDV